MKITKINKTLTSRNKHDKWGMYHSEICQSIYEHIEKWKNAGRPWSGTYFTSSIWRFVARLLEEEYKTGVAAGAKSIIEHSHTHKDCVPKEKLKKSVEECDDYCPHNNSVKKLLEEK